MADIKATAGAANSGDRQGIGSKQERPAELTRPIVNIQVGQRHRRDLGDIDSLASSIADVGLLHPVVITPDGMLIAGERRLEAYRRLGLDSVPVRVVDIDGIARGELAENAHRKDFTPSEMVAIAATVEDRERVLARQRMGEGGKVGKLSTPSEAGKTRDKIAAPLGISGKTLERARVVVAAAKEDPKTFGKLQEDMDRTGRINGIFRRVKIIKQAVEIRKESPPLPGRGPYRVIVADPPWPYEVRDEDPSHRGARPYPTMSIADICGVNVQNIAHDDCIVWLWVTNHHLREAFAVLDAWGFEQKTMLTWAKDRMGNGDWLRGQTEHCLMAVRGKPAVHLTNQTTLLQAPARGHSIKPVEFYALVESLCPASRYCDLFSRYRHNDKWDCHGDEAPAEVADDLSIPTFLQRGVTP